MDKENENNAEEGFDDVDGALFSRIPSKQHDIDKMTKFPPQTSGHDNIDGALFSRISSQKKVSTEDKMHHLKQTPGQAEDITSECTIKPEDLSDSENEDDIPICSDTLLSNKTKSPEGNESSSSSSCYDDHSDAIQGSRVDLSHKEESEIRPVASSTFYTQPESEYLTNDEARSENNIQESGVSFYLQVDKEQETKMLSEDSNPARNNQKQKRVKERSAQKRTYDESCEKSLFKCDENLVPLNKFTSLNATDENDANVTKQASAMNSACTNIKHSLGWRLTKALLFPVMSLVIYFWDIVSDIRLAVSYRENGNIDLFWITLSCIIIPHVLMAVVDVSWVWLDRKREHSKHILRTVLGCLTLGRIIRALTYMRHVYNATVIPKTKNSNEQEQENHRRNTRAWHKARARDEKRDCFMLDFINAFMESAPQLFVQLYLYYAYDLELTVLRVLNLLSSWISIAWTYAAYYRCNREALVGEQDVKIIGFLFFFFSALSALAARFICTALFLVNFYIWIGVTCIASHFILMFLWICIKQRPKLQGTTTSACGRSLYYVFFAYVSILCFMNLSNTRAKLRMTLFYLLIYIENTLMAVLSIWQINQSGTESSTAMHLMILPIGCILHVVLLGNYYLFLHPKTGVCYNCTNTSNVSKPI